MFFSASLTFVDCVSDLNASFSRIIMMTFAALIMIEVFRKSDVITKKPTVTLVNTKGMCHFRMFGNKEEILESEILRGINEEIEKTENEPQKERER